MPPNILLIKKGNKIEKSLRTTAVNNELKRKVMENYQVFVYKNKIKTVLFVRNDIVTVNAETLNRTASGTIRIFTEVVFAKDDFNNF